MGNEIFRKKSLEKIQSPESLNDYLRVSNPGMWLLLAAIAVLLAGACIWSIFGTVRSSTTAVATVGEEQIICYVDEQDQQRVQPGMKVLLEGREGIVSEVPGDDGTGFRVNITMDDPPAPGYYLAEIILNEEHPVSFVLN